ncbi:1,4-dihydroxy-2-naphthoate octaprenyltransferase [Aggregatimonas sangjinii]|uniref:1,4-dihydroxy-2-naphthoate octaprenyltransferase n=1 Tax=Aggregatimonas sangjinii TaxID=2583587 RepID=A0A5B7SNP4_9FLAO|nr:1,4-dihydroxy-2-naphthoate octaprenyltransferase [Aggregatimonas sangjinii]QCX00186.1 1,4-dihydroxy-2-naphthoate octaprenyltransferase [Aggregatimonas sangjinii]
MRKLKAWLNAARLRTLPLSVSGVITGTALANFYKANDITILFLALLTTIAFQVTSNFANDYGDGVKGTDNEDRIGPKRAMQSGLLSSTELKNGIILSAFISLTLVIILIYRAFGTENLLLVLVFLSLGILSIWAAIKYTVGERAYGYRGLGDIFVFLFFGILAVLGTMFLYTKTVTAVAVMPAIAIGALSTGVLNLNNLRDFESDKKVGKNTLIVKMGLARGKIYHYGLLGVSFLCIIGFLVSYANRMVQFVPLLAFLPILFHLRKIYTIKEPESFDPELKKLALSTFLLAVLLFISCNNFL